MQASAFCILHPDATSSAFILSFHPRDTTRRHNWLHRVACSVVLSTTMSNSKLVEIAPSNWPQLRDLYRRDWPDNLVGFYTVDTFLRWRKQKGTIDHLVIYSLDGDWKKDGTYVCIVSKFGKQRRVQAFNYSKFIGIATTTLDFAIPKTACSTKVNCLPTH